LVVFSEFEKALKLTEYSEKLFLLKAAGMK